MRMPRLWGIVATAFLALGLGIGIGSAAVSSHHASSDVSLRDASNGTSQWDNSKAETSQESGKRTVSDDGKGQEKTRWQGEKKGKDHGGGDSQVNHAWTSSTPSNQHGTRQSLKQEQWVKWVDFFAKHHAARWNCRCDKKGAGG